MSHSEETKRKMRLAKRRFFRNGGKPWNYDTNKPVVTCGSCGKKFKVPRNRIKRPKTGLNFCSQVCRLKVFGFKKGELTGGEGFRNKKGDKHWNWKGGISGEHDRVKQTKEYKEWRDAIYRKFGWTCQECGYKGGLIVAHHIKSFAEFPKLRFDVSNGIVLCRGCHQLVHKPRRKDYYKKRVRVEA